MSGLKPRIIMRSQHRLVIPDEICEQLGLKEGSLMELQVYGTNRILIVILNK